MRRLVVGVSLIVFGVSGVTSVTASEAERLLERRSAEFEQEVIEVAPGVYTAVGFGVSTTSMIVGDAGIVIIDAQIDARAAEAVLSEFRKITDKPVKGIVLTHAHGDHTGGAAVFAAAGDNVPIWARKGFNHEARTLSAAGLKVQRQRGARQAGFLLEREQRINNGVAQAYYPERRGGAFSAGAEPTELISQPRTTIRRRA